MEKKEGQEPIKENVFFNAEVMPPEEFVSDPFGYFEREGRDTRPGKIFKVDERGIITRDHSAVKKFPEWKWKNGNLLEVIGKKVITRRKLAETGDPLHEFTVMTYAREHNLPCARPLAHAEKAGQHLLVMEKIPGQSLFVEKDQISEAAKAELQAHGFSDEDIDHIVTEATTKMAELSIEFERAGIKRPWHLKDMVVQIDYTQKNVISLTPVDWERTKIEAQK